MIPISSSRIVFFFDSCPKNAYKFLNKLLSQPVSGRELSVLLQDYLIAPAVCVRSWNARSLSHGWRSFNKLSLCVCLMVHSVCFVLHVSHVHHFLVMNVFSVLGNLGVRGRGSKGVGVRVGHLGTTPEQSHYVCFHHLDGPEKCTSFLQTWIGWERVTLSCFSK